MYQRDPEYEGINSLKLLQKVVELAPAPNLPNDVRQGILDAAIAVGRTVGIDNASTVEFLYDTDSKKFYFIEVNPRIQVEHTVTEVPRR